MSANSLTVKMPTKVSVLLPIPLNNPFDYRSDQPLTPGTLVKVSFGPRKLYGVTWQEKNRTPPKTLKPLLMAFKDIRLPEISLKFIQWVSEYTMFPQGQILKMTLPVPEAFEAHG